MPDRDADGQLLSYAAGYIAHEKCIPISAIRKDVASRVNRDKYQDLLVLLGIL